MTTWKDRIENIELSITTGDGKVWKPLWKKSEREVNYNIASFEAIEIEGSYAERKKKKGDKFPIILFFTGEDCVDKAREFEISARDRRSWIFKHPYYDTIKVQPAKLRFDYSEHNVVKITGILWETIAYKFPRENLPPAKLVSKGVENLYNEVVLSFVEEVDPPPAANIIPSKAFINLLKNTLEKLAELKDDIANVKELARTASAAAQNMIQNVTNYIESVINLIIFPLLIVQNIRSKIDAMIEAANNLKDIFISIPEAIPTYYEAQATSLLGSLCNLVVDAEYRDSIEVFYAIDSTTDLYDGVRLIYDDIGYLQNPEVALQLDVVINLTIGNLYEIAYTARQQRIIVLGEDSNLIVLAHKYYGTGDDNITEFIEQNNIKSGEYLQLKKGREIIYFV